MKEIVGKKTFTIQCMIFIWVVFTILTCCVTFSLAIDTIYYRYTNPRPANTTGDCYLEIYETGSKVTGRLVDTRVGDQKPMNTNITFNGIMTGKWEAGKWLGESDLNNGRIIGTWSGRNPQHNKDMDRLETYATNGRIEIFMGSSVGSGTLRVLMGADVYEYNFRMQGRVSTIMSPPKDPMPKPKPQISDGTLQLPPPVTQAPKTDSKARFSNISGQVEISRDGGKTWQFVKLNTVIYVGDHIKTGEDSKCVMGFADLSTFVLNPESEVVVSAPPEKDSKLELVYGKIMVNIKKMLKDGSMEVNMSQAVCGIKGTIFEASHDRKTGIERVSVTEGRVEVRHKRTGKRVLVGSGQAVRITSEGIFLEGVGTPGASQTGGSQAGELSTPAGAKYVGCYKDTGDRDLAGYSIAQNNMTTKLCVSICSQKGFAYSATQFGSYCFCGNKYGKHGTAQNCNMKCAGNSSLICGGDGANSVYDLSSQQPAKPISQPVRESQIGQQAQAKAKAAQLWNEGSALYRQNRISDALIKLKESLKYQSTPEKINTIQNIEAQQAKSKVDQPAAQTPSKCVVQYGADGKYNRREFAAGTSVGCNNGTFGDPAYGIAKKCYIGPEVKASENESFIVPNTCHIGN